MDVALARGTVANVRTDSRAHKHRLAGSIRDGRDAADRRLGVIGMQRYDRAGVKNQAEQRGCNQC